MRTTSVLVADHQVSPNGSTMVAVIERLNARGRRGTRHAATRSAIRLETPGEARKLLEGINR